MRIPAGTKVTSKRSWFAFKAKGGARFKGKRKCAGLNSACASLRTPAPRRDMDPTRDGLFAFGASPGGKPTKTSQTTPGWVSVTTSPSSWKRLSVLFASSFRSRAYCNFIARIEIMNFTSAFLCPILSAPGWRCEIRQAQYWRIPEAVLRGTIKLLATVMP